MITSPAELPAIADRISYDNLEKLKTVDFQHYVKVAKHKQTPEEIGLVLQTEIITPTPPATNESSQNSG